MKVRKTDPDRATGSTRRMMSVKHALPDSAAWREIASDWCRAEGAGKRVRRMGRELREPAYVDHRAGW